MYDIDLYHHTAACMHACMQVCVYSRSTCSPARHETPEEASQVNNDSGGRPNA